MTQYSKANLKALYDTTFADNTTGDISEGDMRQFKDDLADTFDPLRLSSATNVFFFVSPTDYGTVASPRTGNITDDLTGAANNITQKMYHNDSVEPSVPAGWVSLGGSYVVGTLNIIYAEWISGTRVEYWIVSSGSAVYTKKVTISSAEILALNTTPKTLVSAGGAGTIIEFDKVLFYLDYNSVAYTTNTILRLVCNGVVLNSVTDVLPGTADTYRYLPAASVAATTTDIRNQPLQLEVQTGDPTAGNSPLYVYITYRIITL